MLRIAVAVLGFLLAACVVDDDDLATDEAASVVDNGKNLNGKNLNGKNLNGKNLNGSELGEFIKYVQYSGAGAQLTLEGSEIVIDGVGGTAVEGATLKAKSDTNRAVFIRIVDVIPPSSGDTWGYVIEYRETDGSWQPFCLDLDTMTNHPAIPIDGYWDFDSGTQGDGSKHTTAHRFVFGCTAIGAIGKCVEAGYRPWASAALDEHHQACVRAIRADYCGTSTPYTLDGKLINIYDGIGVQLDTEADWPVEAEWTAGGASCISHDVRLIALPPCFPDLQSEDCGADPQFEGDTLVITEVPPGGPIIIDPRL